MSLKNFLVPNCKQRSMSANNAENENVLKTVTKSTLHGRNPLKDLKNNVQAENKEQKPVKLTSSFKKEKKRVRFVARSNSTSQTEKKTLGHVASRNITERRTKDVQDQDEVFVPAEEHFINFVYNGSQSRIKDISNIEKLETAQNVPVIPARKLTLVRRSIQKRRLENNVTDVYTDFLYDDEYGLVR